MSSPVHFLVPLPDGISPAALDLFGFWSYELRVGHLLWSTAQGRFGRPFSVRGVQRPCRQLMQLSIAISLSHPTEERRSLVSWRQPISPRPSSTVNR